MVWVVDCLVGLVVWWIEGMVRWLIGGWSDDPLDGQVVVWWLGCLVGQEEGFRIVWHWCIAIGQYGDTSQFGRCVSDDGGDVPVSWLWWLHLHHEYSTPSECTLP